MLSVSYDSIYSRFFSKVQAFDLMGEYPEDVSIELMSEWLISVKSNPRVRKIFSELSLDADERILSFTLKYSEDDDSDIDYVTELFALGVAWKWVEPKYKSVLNTSQFFGGKEQQFYAQSNHMDKLEAMNKSAKHDFIECIHTRGYYKNSYLQEE